MVSLSFSPLGIMDSCFIWNPFCYAYNVAIAIWPTDRQWMRGGKHGSLSKHFSDKPGDYQTYVKR